MTTQPRPSSPVAVIGAGMAGMACAARLAEAGVAVEVFEKSRGLGGRMASRQSQAGGVDHGAQFFRARDAAFRAQVERWMADGHVAPWQPRLVEMGRQGKLFIADTHPRYVGAPTMNAPVKALAASATVHPDARVAAVASDGGRWRLGLEDGSRYEGFARVVVAVPAPQAVALLEAAPALAGRAAAAEASPCWAVMARFNRRLEVDFDAVRFPGGAVAWACRDGSKAAREDGETWVLHADADWSAGHLEQAPGAVKRVLLDAFFAQMEHPTRAPAWLECHLWRYARVAAPQGLDDLYDAEAGIGICGDWVRGQSNVENAWLSGADLAARMLRGG